MLIKHGHTMLTVPLSPSMAGLVRETYREERRRWKLSRHEARRETQRFAFFLVVCDHPEFEQRPLADAPEYVRRAS